MGIHTQRTRTRTPISGNMHLSSLLGIGLGRYTAVGLQYWAEVVQMELVECGRHAESHMLIAVVVSAVQPGQNWANRSSS